MSASIPDSTLEKFTNFGDLLRFLRRRAGITQLELSIAVGYSDAQISRLEQNQRPPDIPTIEARFVPALDLEDEPKVVMRLLDLAANVRREDAPGLGICPYKGLSYFDEADADLFVGREILTSKLTERILCLSSNESPDQIHFLAIVGASGSGKSSLARAGLIPALRWNKASAEWQVFVLTPADHPLESLAAALTQGDPSVAATAAFMDDLARDQRCLHLFASHKLGSAKNSRVLLLVDQFEEVFALCRSELERASFIYNLLTAASEVNGPVMVVITLRADFYSYCANYSDLREALAKSQEYIGAMNDDELRRAIEEPALRGQWEFEPGLVDLLMHEVGHEPGALPLLSHALLETWQRRRGRIMTLSGYTSSGGVRGAIAETAEAVFTDRFTPQDQDIARRIFLRLTELGEEPASGDTRRRVALTELTMRPEEADATRNVLKVLADARLITTSEENVEVAHEALIREWPRLREWLEDNREGLLIHRRLIEASQEWDDLAREPELLYRGARLIQAQEWGETYQTEMNDLEREFLDASISWAEQEMAEREEQRLRELEAAQKLAEAEKQRAEAQTRFARQLTRRAVYLTGAMIIALLMAFTALYFGSRARQTAVTSQNERRIATSRELAADALNNLSVDPERSMLLAMQSISTTRSTDATVLPESLEALHRSIVSSPIRYMLEGHGTKVLTAAFSPDGKSLATIGDDGTTILWDSLNGAELRRLPGTTQKRENLTDQRLAYSPDGKLLAACDSDQIKIYNPSTGDLVMTLEGEQADASAVAFSPDGKYLASGSMDGKARIWDASTGALLHLLSGHSDAVESVTYSPDGKWLVTTSDDATFKIWDAATGALLRDFTGFSGLIDSAAFSPDGTRLAFTADGSLHVWQVDINLVNENYALTKHEIYTIPEGGAVVFSPDGSRLAAAAGDVAKVWDAATGGELMTLVGHTGWVSDVAFSPDGERLASTSLDKTVKIWSLEPGAESVTVSGPGAVYGVRLAYNPNGQEFATSAGDGSATIWDATNGQPLRTFSGHDREVLSVAFSSDGKRFATGSLDTTAMVWDSATGKKLLTLSGHEMGVRDIAFSPDGSLIATGGFDGKAILWDATKGEPLHTILGHEGLVLGVAFSPDGTHLATSSTDKTAKIWDVKSGQLLLTLTGHTDGIPDIAYSPDGTMIATGSGDATVKIWDAATGKELRTLPGHGSQIQSVAFSPDGKILASGSGDHTAKLWDVATGKELLTLPGDLGGVTGVAFSILDGGSNLVVASADGVVRVFLLNTDELLPLARSRVTRSLTDAECQRYLHVDQCPGSSSWQSNK